MLPDDVLVEIFDTCRVNDSGFNPWHWQWVGLVHVCKRWRQIILAYPRHLNLQLLCTNGTPVAKNLGCWPAFPIILEYGHCRPVTRKDGNDLVAALEHPDRVHHVDLSLTISQMGKVATAMQKPFPALTHLMLRSNYRHSHDKVLPDRFLGGFAPRLQEIVIRGVPFPALPGLLTSASDLVRLELFDLPQNGYISPEAMVMGLATATRLRHLWIGFTSPTSRRQRIHLSHITRTVLPALTSLGLCGVHEYMEDFVVRLDAPRLDWVGMGYMDQPASAQVDFRVPNLFGLIERSEDPQLAQFERVDITFTSDHVSFKAYHKIHSRSSPSIRARIFCHETDRQVSHIGRVLGQFSASNVDRLHIFWRGTGCPLTDTIDNTGWLELLRPFTTVQALHVSEKLARHLALALENVTMEVLPALDLLCLNDHSVSVDNFVTVRRLSGRPITIVRTLHEFDRRLEPYPGE
ncbi:hypothetical protein EDB89DRAFT_1546968 [Lactarius sanguifluus]|nr:hypothetical protein EDB89DRAFT_1546968 [Lactarius sanguifluus]